MAATTTSTSTTIYQEAVIRYNHKFIGFALKEKKNLTKEKRGKGERETRKVVEAKFEVEILDEMESLEDDETDFQERSEAAE